MRNEIDSIAAATLSLTMTYLLHSTLLLGGTWAVLRLGRVRSWALSERLWKLAAVLPFCTASLTLPASLSRPIARLALDRVFFQHQAIDSDAGAVLQPPSQSATYVSETALGRQPLSALEKPIADKSEAVHSIQWQLNTSDAARLAKTSVESPERQPQSATAFRFAAVGICWSISTFVAIGLIRLIYQTLAFRRALGECRLIDRGAIRDSLDDILRRAKVRREIRLLLSSADTQPAAFGLFRWTILLPEKLIPLLKPDEMRALLTHEVAHLVRGDVSWLWIGRVLCGCFAFQPLNYLARSRWRRAAEFLCDQWAVQNSANRFALARCLTRVAEWTTPASAQPAALAAVGGRSSLADRVESLIYDTTGVDSWNNRRRRRLVSAAALTVGLAFIACAPRTNVHAEPSSPDSDRHLESADEHKEVNETKLRGDIESLGQELRELATELQHVDLLLKQKRQTNPAFRAVAARLTARSATLLNHQQQLTTGYPGSSLKRASPTSTRR